MRTLYPVALAALVVSCHLDKLLNGGGGNGPPSEAAPARVAFLSSLGNARAGQPISPPVQVTVQDSAGRVTLRDTLVTLSLAANPSGDSLRGKKQVRSVNGVATFAELRLDKADSGYTLTAAAPNLHPDTSAAFSVMPGPPPPPPPPTHLGFTQQPQTTTQAGATITPPVQVAAFDASEHVVQGFTGSIGLALEPVSNGGTLSGGTPINAVNGIATFPSLSVDKAGTGYTLRATASGLTDATSSPFNITPPPPTTGDLTVTTSTSGPNPPSGYTVTVDGGQSRNLGLNTSTPYTGLTPTSHTVQLNGIPTNCSVSEANPQTVTVPAGGTATASYTINCAATTGDLTVTASTTGPEQPSGYTVSVTGGGSQTVGATGSVTFNGLVTGSHTVTLSGAPSNCSVSGGTSQTVNVAAGQTATASFSISCTAPNVAPVVNAGPDDPAVTGLLYSFTWSFSDGNHNGPWSYRIDWGDGSTSSGNVSNEGSFSAGHTYIIVLPRSFTITVTVTDASGASGSDSKVVSVTLL